MAYKIEHEFSDKFIFGETDPWTNKIKERNFVTANLHLRKFEYAYTYFFSSSIYFFVDLKLMCKQLNIKNQIVKLPHCLKFKVDIIAPAEDRSNECVNKFIKSNENFAYATVVNLQSDRFVQFITKYGTPSGLSDESFEKLENEILTPTMERDMTVTIDVDVDMRPKKVNSFPPSQHSL